jgi:LysR family glycine cleavage system transcriptional activator
MAPQNAAVCGTADPDEGALLMAARPPSLRAVLAFEAAARHGTFRKAAKELNLTDSAVSHAVRTLEDRIGQDLFLRRPGGLSLTDHGRQLAERAVAGLALLAGAFDVQPWSARPKLSIYMAPWFAERIVIPRLGAFMATHPLVEVELKVTSDFDELTDGDVGLWYGHGRWAGVRADLLSRETLVAVASPSYPHGDLPRSANELLRRQPLNETCPGWRSLQGPHGEQAGEGHLVVEDPGMLIAAAAAGLGVALAPALLVAEDLRSGRLVRVPGIEAPSSSAYWLVWNNGSQKAALIEDLGRWLAAELMAASPTTLALASSTPAPPLTRRAR